MGYNLEKMLADANITQRSMARRLGMPISQLREIIASDNDDLKINTYWRYLGKINDIHLIKELKKFFRDYFNNEEEATLFLNGILNYEDSNIPRRMINYIKRLLSLADDIEKIRPHKDSLKIFFILVCIESLYTLEFPNNEESKLQIVIRFFNDYVEQVDKEFILQNVTRSFADKKCEKGYEDIKLNIEIFVRILVEIRNKFAHEGIYWDFNFLHDMHSVCLMNFIEVEESKEEFQLIRKRKKPREERIYDIKLTYKDFRRICTKGMINYVNSYLSRLSNNNK
ncbi:MAG TPA: hypothetical protein VEF53_00935 [Patescibacteria group bacterium]|nr:hypothetical protein [Patescibacteria group bacterium]